MFEFETTLYSDELDEWLEVVVDVQSFYPASQGNFFEPPTDNEWIYSVYAVETSKQYVVESLAFDYEEDIIKLIEEEYALKLYNERYDSSGG